MIIKRLKFICLFVCLAYSMVANAFDFSYKGVIFACKVLKDQTVCITKFDRTAKSVEIPGQVMDYKNRKKYKVKSIDLHFNGYTYLTEELTIGEGVEELEKRCFQEFISLRKITLPQSLKVVGKKSLDFININLIEIPTEEVKNLLVLSGIDYDKLSEPLYAQQPEDLFKIVSFIKKQEEMRHSEQRVDNDNNLCALIKITANRQLNYSSPAIPEPTYGYISFNKKGIDYVWMKDGATTLTLFSDNKEFENILLDFKEVSEGEIPKLEAGYIYELKIEFNNK